MSYRFILPNGERGETEVLPPFETITICTGCGVCYFDLDAMHGEGGKIIIEPIPPEELANMGFSNKDRGLSHGYLSKGCTQKTYIKGQQGYDDILNDMMDDCPKFD